MRIDYLFVIPWALIYTLLYWVTIPNLSGKWTKRLAAIVFIPVAYFFTGYVEAYLPALLYRVSRWFSGY